MEKKKILIIEDNKIVALDVKQIVTKFGYLVTKIVSREQEAIKSIKENEPNIIIVDINLKSEINGIEIVKKIHNIKYIPIIYLTGNEEDEIVHKALETCPIGYLVKPFNKTELKSVLKLALCEKKQSNLNQRKHLGYEYHFDIANKHLYYKNNIQKLSSKESNLLSLLIQSNGELVTYQTIKYVIWQDDPVSNETIRNTISRLRKKLRAELIETIYAYGFRIRKV